MAKNKFLLCSTCILPNEQGTAAEFFDNFTENLQSQLVSAGLSETFDVQKTACMGICSAPITVALQGMGKATMVFSSIQPDSDMGDIIATCNAYLKAPNGWIEDAHSCGRLRYCLHARIPALSQ